MAATKRSKEWARELPEFLNGVRLVPLCLTTQPLISEHLARTTDGRFWLIWWDSARLLYKWSQVTQEYARNQSEPVRIYRNLDSWIDLFEATLPPRHQMAPTVEFYYVDLDQMAA